MRRAPGKSGPPSGGVGLRMRLLALWLLWRDPRTPRVAKWLAILVLAYAVSPIDLIPDFIPLLGALDDLLLVPLGLALIVWLTPATLWRDCLAQAQAGDVHLPRIRWGVLLVGLLWFVAAGLLGWWLFSLRWGGG